MGGATFPITITAQMRHGILWEARQKLGSSKALAEALGVSQQHVGALVNFKWSPGERWLAKHGEDVELRLSEILGRPVTLAEIFPPELCSESFQRLAKRIERTIEVSPERLIEAGAAVALPPAPQEVVERGELASVVSGVLEFLKPRDREIVKMRFGLGADNHEQTYEEIAGHFGVTRERIRQVEMRALRILRHPSHSKILKPFVEANV